MLIILGFWKGIRAVLGIGFLKGWALIIGLGNDLINLTKFIYLFIGANLVGIIKSFIAGLFPSLVDIRIRFFILFILNLYITSKADILIKADFI